MRGIVLVRALLLPAMLAGQEKTGAVEGVVTNSITGVPLKRATVTLRSPQSLVGFSALTDAAGRFRLTGVTPENYYVTATCQGFNDSDLPRPIEVDAEQTVRNVDLRLPPLSVIAGRVLDEDGDPLTGVPVEALQWDYSKIARRLVTRATATSDDRGQFRLIDLKPGRYYVVAEPRREAAPPGVVHRSRPEDAYPATFLPGAVEPSQASPIEIAAGAEMAGMDVKLRRTRMYHVRGKAVEAQSGEPLRAVVIVERCGAGMISGFGARHSVSVGSDGSFDLAGVLPGSYCATVEQFRGRMPLFAREAVVVSNRDVEGVALLARPSLELRAVVNLDGAAAPELQKVKVTLDPIGRYIGSTFMYPSRDGSIVFANVEPQAYQVGAESVPAGVYLKSIRYGEQDVGDGRIDLTNGSALLTLSFATNPGQVSASVRVGEMGRPGILVTLSPTGGLAARPDLVKTAITQADGSCQFQSVAPGDYRVFAWEGFDRGVAMAPEFRQALEGKASTITVRAGGAEAVVLKPVSAEDIREARSRMP